MAVTRPQPLTDEQAAAWTKRKTAQWERIRDAFALPAGAEPGADHLFVSLVHTGNTFMVYARSSSFNDEFCIGQPAHTVTRDDRLHNVAGRDASDRDVATLIEAWRVRRPVTNIASEAGRQ